MTLTAAEIRTLRASNIKGGARMFWELATAICAEYDVPVKALSAKHRGTLATNEARQFLCLYAMRRGMSSAQIGRLIHRDHTSVLAARDRAAAKEAALALRDDAV